MYSETRIFDQFERIRRAVLAFSKSVDHYDSPCWMAPPPGSNRAPELEDALLDLWYLEDQDGRETRIYPGLVALNHEQMTLAAELNLAKDHFRKTVQMVKAEHSTRWREIQGRLTRRYSSLNEQLSREGLVRLHLKQVFRHLPIVVKRPEKVGFGWYSSGRSITRISKQDAWDRLTQLNTESAHIQIQLQRLASLPDNEPLARVQRQAPVLRANLVFADGRRKSMNISLPLLFPSQGHTDLPAFSTPPPSPPTQRQRLVRSDNKLEDDVFLPSIRVHRYRSAMPKRYF
ncbi:MAG: DNA replication terminus site-binding protein [Saccharospirillum sp.]